MIARDSWAGHRLLLFGTDSAFSTAVFKELLLGRVNTVAVVVPGPAPVPSLLPVSVPSRTTSVVSLAAERGIPVHHVRRLEEEGNIEAFKDMAPDFLLVACFPYRVPLAVRRVPKKDALNLHPSLLPRYRGPTPLFWQFRCGETNTGVTLHRLAHELDSGDIIAQKRVTLPDGIDATEADERLAVHGARLFTNSLMLYDRDAVRSRPQDESASNHFPVPGEDDFRVSTGWDARRLFNFMRGTATWQRSYLLRVDDRDYRLCKAISFSADGRLEKPVEVERGEIRVQCRRGVLLATLES